MKKTVCGILAAVIMLSLLTSCGYKEPPEVGFLVPEQFTGYKIGTVSDLVSKKVITEKIDSPRIVKVSSVEKGIEELLSKQIHGFALPAVYAINEMKKDPLVVCTYTPIVEKNLCAISLSSSPFVMHADAAITRMKNDGTMQRIADAHSPYADETAPYVRPADYDIIDGRTITIGICSDEAHPYNYRDNDGKLIGINVDTAYEIAKGAHAELIIKEYAEDELIPALDSGDVDMILSQYFEDEENPISAKYLYSHHYCDASVYLLVRSVRADRAETTSENTK